MLSLSTGASFRRTVPCQDALRDAREETLAIQRKLVWCSERDAHLSFPALQVPVVTGSSGSSQCGGLKCGGLRKQRFRRSLGVAPCWFSVNDHGQSHFLRSLPVAQALLTKSHQELEVDSLARADCQFWPSRLGVTLPKCFLRLSGIPGVWNRHTISLP